MNELKALLFWQRAHMCYCRGAGEDAVQALMCCERCAWYLTGAGIMKQEQYDAVWKDYVDSDYCIEFASMYDATRIFYKLEALRIYFSYEGRAFAATGADF